MSHTPVPADAPPGLRLRPLGVISWLKDRRFFLAADGTVWCREAGYGGYIPPRWLPVPPEDWNRIEAEGRTLAARIADLKSPDAASTVRGGGKVE